MVKKKRKSPAKPSANLPPFPWETHAQAPGGQRVRTARPDLEEADVIEGADRDADGELVLRRARVWRTAMPATMKALPPESQAAFLDYAEASEAIHASTGACDPSGCGGGSSHAKSPSHRALVAAERLRGMNRALAGQAVLRPGRGRRQVGLCQVGYVDLARWVACDGLGREDILRKMGLPVRSDVAGMACTLAIAEAARRLAECCGYRPGTDR